MPGSIGCAAIGAAIWKSEK